MRSNEVPLMFQAQVQGRGQIQYVGNPDQAERWVDEWVEGAATQAPRFSSNVKTREYKITWRFVSNSGQDQDIIRPVIAAKGFPYYPGASMKGAFLRACTSQQGKRYCGGESASDMLPGILRFHGGYPKDATWGEEPLVDVVHPQQNWQVKNREKPAAKIQISLYQPTLVFGISSTEKLEESEWDTIWSIWEKAIERGLGSRVSAGYGQPIKHLETKLFSVDLSGQGLASQLFDKTGEFRPNMFKAALRGHTLRLFSGVTDENTAEDLTRELWGGFAGKNGAVVGHLGIAFHAIDLEVDEYRYGRGITMPTYDLKKGTLSILCMGQVSDEYKKELKNLVTHILRFAMLLGGFGKSWRRIDHSIFFPEYLNNKPMIGCHWQFIGKSTKYYFPVKNLSHITNILDNVCTSVNNWLKFKGIKAISTDSSWRETWHPKKVQVWGRLAEDEEDSEAVRWFHGPYQGTKSIKGSNLTGKMSQIGCIWHRMYPRYILTPDGEMKRKKQESYVELLTIFPDGSDEITQDFLNFLETSKTFTKLWGE
ncbi:hypothetical protein NUACC21_60260 [Scytonema sp. NUACC21]